MKLYHRTIRNGSVHQQFSPCLLQLHLALLYSVLQFSLSSQPKIELVPNQLLLALVYPHQSAWEIIFGPSEAGWHFTKERWNFLEASRVSQRHACVSCWLVVDCNLIQAGSSLTEACCPIPGGDICMHKCMHRWTDIWIDFFPFWSAGPFGPLCVQFSKRFTVFPQNCPFGSCFLSQVG